MTVVLASSPDLWPPGHALACCSLLPGQTPWATAPSHPSGHKKSNEPQRETSSRCVPHAHPKRKWPHLPKALVLRAGLAPLANSRPGSKYLRLPGPCRLVHTFPTRPLQCGSRGQQIQECAQLCSNKTGFTETDGEPESAGRHRLPTGGLGQCKRSALLTRKLPSLPGPHACPSRPGTLRTPAARTRRAPGLP